MHKAIVIFLEGKIKFFLDSLQMSLYGEKNPVKDDEKCWQRIMENSNASPQDLEFLLLYDCRTTSLMERISNYLSDVKILRIINLTAVADFLSVLHGAEKFVSCGCFFERGENKEWRIEFLPVGDEGDFIQLSFDQLFSPLSDIENLQKNLSESQRNLARSNNRLKSLQKKFEDSLGG